ncbi:hypothetical protein M9H77_19108 [Catharanthus roseus]|uniref:Uncharacterized protein n=1 Tax=Catharanthus roseus TaxID=4058 RepID=A0ACC0B9C7_CATRO|nr:hypothetical protein M9H77_19108 [Catharanthus roseus]
MPIVLQDGVFLLYGCCDPFNKKAPRGSRRASFQLPIVSSEWTHLKSLKEEIEMKILAGYPANSAKSKLVSSLSQDFADFLAETPLCLVLGSKGSGLSEKSRQECELVSIPMAGEFESLNVLVASGIFLYFSSKLDEVFENGRLILQSKVPTKIELQNRMSRQKSDVQFFPTKDRTGRLTYKIRRLFSKPDDQHKNLTTDFCVKEGYRDIQTQKTDEENSVLDQTLRTIDEPYTQEQFNLSLSVLSFTRYPSTQSTKNGN